jgi:hypothetical protein
MKPSLVAGCAGALAVVCLAAPARAEDPDPHDARTNKDPIVEPLRLGVLRSAYPFIGHLAGCERAGTPEDRSLVREVLPNLKVLAMMRSGCGLETGGGGGLVYTVPITSTVSLVAGFGLYLRPPVNGVREPTFHRAFRLDVVFRLAQGRSLNLGLFGDDHTIGVGFGLAF